MIEIKSNPAYQRAWEVLTNRLLPKVNKGIDAQKNELKQINAEDIIIVTRTEMSRLLKEELGNTHPDILAHITEAASILGVTVGFRYDISSANAYTIGSETKKILISADMEYVQELNFGHIEYFQAMNFIPLVTHEAAHYSATRKLYSTGSCLENLVRCVQFPLVPEMRKDIGDIAYNEMLNKIKRTVREIPKLCIETEGGCIYVRGYGNDGQLYTVGFLGNNFNETLTDYLTARAKREAINTLCHSEKKLDPKRVQECIIRGGGDRTRTELNGVKSYSLEEVKVELHRIGIEGFPQIVNAYFSGTLPQLWCEKNPTSTSYFD